MSVIRRAAVWLPVLLALGLSGCGNSGDAQIRLLNASAGYAALDVYFQTSGTAGTPQISNVGSGTVSGYSAVIPAAYTVYFTSHGVGAANALASLSKTLANSERRTYVAYGDSGSFGVLDINEQQSAPNGGYANVEVLNADPDAGSLDVYLTSPGIPLSNASPNFSALAGGKASPFSAIPQGTYELRITGAGTNSDLRFDLPSLQLSDQETLSLIITEAPGGYLVNVMALPQKGTLTVYTNPDARVRAAIGVSGASSVSASVGSTALLSAAPASTIGTYELVPAGNQAVTVTVNGTAISAPSQSLTAGLDYTLLIYGTPTTVQESWLADRNIPPLSGYASVRLVNAMSGSGDPLSLAVNFMPVASGVPLGSDLPSGASSGTSPYDTEVVATTTGTVTVTDYTTSQTLYSQTAAPLGSGNVYSMFMFGSTSAPVGVLSQDR
ncbi:MAG: DUF4397 domain-containing protein [Steroidobacteraceae bacterium]